MNNIDRELLRFTLALPRTAHKIAQKNVNGITSKIKAKQVYLNTLAVYAVNYYFECMGFNPDWKNSNSSNPILMQLSNIADLDLQDVGKVECIAVSPGQQECQISPESENERVGYMPVEINEDLTQAIILGFTTQKLGTIQLSKLKDLEYALEYLTDLEQPAIVKLKDWLNGLFDRAWEPLDLVLQPRQLRLRSHNKIERGQKIDFVTPNGLTSFILIVDIKSTEIAGEVDVLIQVYPHENNELPDGVKLDISDNEETTLTVTSRSGNNGIQLNFTAVVDEEFTVRVTFEETEVVKKFLV